MIKIREGEEGIELNAEENWQLMLMIWMNGDK